MRPFSALLLFQALVGGASAAPPARPVSYAWRLPPGTLVEITLRLGAGAEAVAEFTAEGGPVAWDVHSHPPSGLVVHDRGRGGTGRARFRPEAAGTYFLSWENEGGATASVALRVQLTLTGEASVESAPLWPSRAAPFGQ